MGVVIQLRPRQQAAPTPQERAIEEMRRAMEAYDARPSAHTFSSLVLANMRVVRAGGGQFSHSDRLWKAAMSRIYEAATGLPGGAA